MLRSREPEPFTVVVVCCTILKIGESGLVLSVSEGFAERDGDVVSGEGRDGEAYVGFGRLEDRVGHLIQFEGNMCHDSQETEVTCSGSEVRWVGDGLVLAVGVDIFDCSDVVVYCFVLTTCAVADRTIDSTDGNSSCKNQDRCLCERRPVLSDLLD